jgi:bis(5'-adenosyl)-triphosphatase
MQETTDLFLTVQRVSRTLQRVYSATALNVAVQDGLDAGQSVPHVHVHIIPRRKADMDERGGGDAVYGMLDGEEGDLGAAWLEFRRHRQTFLDGQKGKGDFAQGPDAEERRPRGEEVMREEAEWLRTEMEKDDNEDDEERGHLTITGDKR